MSITYRQWLAFILLLGIVHPFLFLAPVIPAELKNHLPELEAIEIFVPKYPKRALRKKVSGFVQFKITISSDGDVEEAQIIDSEPKGYFERTAKKVIGKYKFLPRILDKKPVATEGTYTIEFNHPAIEWEKKQKIFKRFSDAVMLFRADQQSGIKALFEAANSGSAEAWVALAYIQYAQTDIEKQKTFLSSVEHAMEIGYPESEQGNEMLIKYAQALLSGMFGFVDQQKAIDALRLASIYGSEEAEEIMHKIENKHNSP